jgi:hypothetical protein
MLMFIPSASIAETHVSSMAGCLTILIMCLAFLEASASRKLLQVSASVSLVLGSLVNVCPLMRRNFYLATDFVLKP